MLIWMFNLSPETVVSGATGNQVEELLSHSLNLDYLKDTNTAMMANGVRFTRTKKGIFPILVENLFKDRKWNKNEQLRLESEIEKIKADKDYNKNLVEELSTKAVQHNAIQMSLKILLNSLYGALSNEHFRYFSTDLAEGITLTGQLAIKYTGKNISAFLNDEFNTKNLNYNVYNDTDSGFFLINQLVANALEKRLVENAVHKIADYVDDWCKTTLEPKLAENCQSLAEYLNAYENKLHFKREKIMPAVIFRAKKNYILTVIDSEGVRYNEPKFSGTGIEYKRSSTPDYIRPRLKPCYMIMLEHDINNPKQGEKALQEYIKTFKAEYMNAHIKDIAFPRGVKEIDKWLDGKGNIVKGAPIHVKATIYHNRLLDSTGLYKKHPYIKEGEKMRFIYLRTPNIINNNAIGFIDNLPSEFGLDDAIDRETQFNKSFLDPIKSFADLMNWKTEETFSLNDLFGDDYIPPKTNNTVQTKPIKQSVKQFLTDLF